MPRKPARVRLNTTAVVKAAAELANAGGIEALTLGALAHQLGVKTPSLYNHVAGLPGLYRELALLSARELGDRMSEAAIGKSGPEAVRAIAQAYRAYVKAFPGTYMAGLRVRQSDVPADAGLQAAEDRVVKVAVAVVDSFGLRGSDALHAVRGLRSVVHGFAMLELAGGFGLPLDCDESFRRLVEMLIRGMQGAAGDQP